MVGKPVEAHNERPAAGLKDRNLQSACPNRPMTDVVGRLGPPGRGVLAKGRSLGHLCHEFNLQAAFAASRSCKPGPSSKYGCLKPGSVPVSGHDGGCSPSGESGSALLGTFVMYRSSTAMKLAVARIARIRPGLVGLKGIATPGGAEEFKGMGCPQSRQACTQPVR